eukprot:Lankesteria_metandrocarpae@DN5417_c0_g1_i1.p1
MEGLRNKHFSGDVMQVLFPWLDARSLYNLMLTCKCYWNWFSSETHNLAFQEYFKQKYFDYTRLNGPYGLEDQVSTKVTTWQDHYIAARECDFSMRNQILYDDIIEFRHELWVRLKDTALRQCHMPRYDSFVMYARINKRTGKPKRRRRESAGALNKILASRVSDSARHDVGNFCIKLDFRDVIVDILTCTTKKMVSGFRLLAMKCVEDSIKADGPVPSAETIDRKISDMGDQIRESYIPGECHSPASFQNEFDPINFDYLQLLCQKLFSEACVRGGRQREALPNSLRFIRDRRNYFGYYRTEYGNITRHHIKKTVILWNLCAKYPAIISFLRIQQFYPYNHGVMYKTIDTDYGSDGRHGRSMCAYIGPAAVLMRFRVTTLEVY